MTTQLAEKLRGIKAQHLSLPRINGKVGVRWQGFRETSDLNGL